MEKNIRSDLRQAITSYSEREGVQGGSETCTVVRVGYGDTDEKTGDGDDGVDDVTIFIGCDRNGQEQALVGLTSEWQYRWDVEETREARLSEVVWTCGTIMGILGGGC